MKLVLCEGIVRNAGGEYPKNRFTLTDDGEPVLNYLCEGYRIFFSHIREPTEFMVEQLYTGRNLANVLKRND